jgi:hypothetical protein
MVSSIIRSHSIERSFCVEREPDTPIRSVSADETDLFQAMGAELKNSPNNASPTFTRHRNFRDSGIERENSAVAGAPEEAPVDIATPG